MIQILDHNLSPIVDYVAMGDIYAETGIPLVLYNPLAESALAISGNIQQVSTSNGYERLKFYRAEIPYFTASPVFYTPADIPGIVVGDIFDLYVHVEGWLPSQVFNVEIPMAIMVASTVIQSYGHIPIAHNLPLPETTYTVYLRRRADSQWFLADAVITRNLCSITSISTTANPDLDWADQMMFGYSSKLSFAPLPSVAAYIESEEYMPILGAIEVAGGSVTHNIFSFNPQRAGITITGGVADA